MVTAKQVQTAYRKLKRLVYYDKTDLRLRQRLAEFECDQTFKSRLSNVEKLLNARDPVKQPIFQTWLSQIDFRIVPKSLTPDPPDEEGKGNFLSNVTSDKVLEVKTVNYFFDGPIELHLIAVLWIMVEGWHLSSQLGAECCGSRLEKEIGDPNDQSAGLFQRYHELYAGWRDSGIKKAKQLLAEEQKNVCILGLDVQQYFYRIRLDFEAVAQSIHGAAVKEGEANNTVITPSSLLKCLQAIHETYRRKIEPSLRQTHEDVSPQDAVIPIGICSSQILANWYLRDFDKAVKTQVRPAYYGRYVDDILIVVATPDDPSKQGRKNAVAAFMDRVLVHSGVLRELKGERYEIAQPGGLFLQQGKCILQYFDAKHSIAGLEKFQKKLEENGSDFLLLPVDEGDNSLEEVAYELLYEGSVNKFRNVKGMAENRYELAKHLARQTILHMLTDDPPDPKISLGLQKFFKGKNAIEFHDLWERVLTFFLVANDRKAAAAFAKQVKAEINRVRFKDEQMVSKLLYDNLRRHLDLSEAMSDALSDKSELLGAGEFFRDSNLIRHHFVRLPLLNYTTFTGSLLARNIEQDVVADTNKQKRSPRFVNFDECLLLANSGCVNTGRSLPFQWATKVYETINGYLPEGMEWNREELKAEVSGE